MLKHADDLQDTGNAGVSFTMTYVPLDGANLNFGGSHVAVKYRSNASNL